ncbi:18794_t:CDS:2 [Gigaspora margarita]|uniref:18794_t:CDS:1 n=1 Tax=Gigaspora margarita TaxID=4874 RepID=A0ABN7VMG7_GIGMA|nr:18794_t:CDS:2 [Gigaspora margarita]
MNSFFGLTKVFEIIRQWRLSWIISDHLLVKCTLKLEHKAKKSCEVIKEINSVTLAEEWDWHKISQSFRKQDHETEQRITKLKEDLAKNRRALIIGREMANTIQIPLDRAGEKSSKYLEDIALDFIKDQYTKIYKKEDVDLDAANSITQNLPSVSEQKNLTLM